MSEQAGGNSPDLKQVWQRVTEGVKEQILMPALWRALEQGKPIVVDTTFFVVGYPTEGGADSHLLTDVRHKNVIEQLLEKHVGRPLTIRVIQGTEREDWDQVLALEREAAKLRARSQAERAPAAAAPSEVSWDSVGEQLIRRYTSTANRQLPNVAAEYLDGATDELAETYRKLIGDEEPDEGQLRSYGRALDRLGDRLALPGVLVGYLVYQKLKQGKGAG